jgi:hypothetical protein
MFKRKGGDAPASPAHPAATRQDALRDELGLHHLWYLEMRLRDELARASRTHTMFSLAAWQLHVLPGETPSPELPALAADIIQSSLRSYAIVARIDADRFVAILFDAPYDAAATVAFRIKGDLQIKVAAAGRWQAGVATFPHDGVDGDGLIQATMRRLQADARAAQHPSPAPTGQPASSAPLR